MHDQGPDPTAIMELATGYWGSATLLAAPFAHADAQQDVAKLVKSGKLQEALQRADAFLATTTANQAAGKWFQLQRARKRGISG